MQNLTKKQQQCDIHFVYLLYVWMHLFINKVITPSAPVWKSELDLF